MFLKSLELENIRCFPHLFVDFDLPGGSNRKWSVVLGENGTGKSTLLRSIALIKAGSDALPGLVGQPGNWIRKGAETARIRAEIETKEGQARAIELVIGIKDSISEIIARSRESLAPLNAALEHTQRNYFVAGYGSSRRLGGRVFSGQNEGGSFSLPRARSVISLFDRYAELNPLESWAMTLDYRSDGAGMNAVAQVLNDFLPEMTFSRIDKRSEALLIKTPDGEVPLQQLSDGYQSVAAWVGDLLYRVTETFEDYSSPLSIRGLLIVDEIDLHLHPKWQRRLLDFLNDRLPNMQLVVTTHSVVTAQQAPEGSLFFLQRGTDGVGIQGFAGDPGKLLVNQLLMSEAFGHAVDESLVVEQAKERYRAVARRDASQPEMAAAKAEVEKTIGSDYGVGDDKAFLTPDQRRLLEKIKKEYAGE